MKQILRVCSLLLPLCLSSVALGDSVRKPAVEAQIVHREVGEESISGRSFRAAQAASKEFASKGLDLSRYRIIVSEHEDVWWVSFIDADVTDEMRLKVRGNSGKIPGLDVELNHDDFSVIRSNFIR